MPHTNLTRELIAVAHALRKSRPAVTTPEYAVAGVFWFATVRNVADALFGKQGEYTNSTRLPEKRHEFLYEAGYFNADTNL